MGASATLVGGTLRLQATTMPDAETMAPADKRKLGYVSHRRVEGTTTGGVKLLAMMPESRVRVILTIKYDVEMQNRVCKSRAVYTIAG